MIYQQNDLILINSPKMAISPTEIRDWTIYRITNPNGRIYIGKTSDYQARVRQYRCLQLKRQDLIMRSIVKYGWDSHKMEAIDTFVGTGHESECKEMFWIRSFMSNICKYPDQLGMNMTDGGEGILGIKRSDQYKEECRQRNVGKTLTEEHKAAISKGLQGKAKGNPGYRHTDEWKKVASLRHTGKVDSEETKRRRYAAFLLKAKPIIVIDSEKGTTTECNTLVDAAKFVGMSRDSIRRILQGKLLTQMLKKNRRYTFKYKSRVEFDRVRMKRRKFKLVDIGELLNKAA